MSSYNNTKRVKDIPFKERWPLLESTGKYLVLIGYIGTMGFLIYVGIEGFVNGHLPWPFAQDTLLTYDQYVKQQQILQQKNDFAGWILSGIMLIAGTFLGFKLLRQWRRHKSEPEKEVKPEE